MLFKGSRAKIHQTSQKNKKQSKKEGGSSEKGCCFGNDLQFFFCTAASVKAETQKMELNLQPWHIWQRIPLGTDHSSVVF